MDALKISTVSTLLANDLTAIKAMRRKRRVFFKGVEKVENVEVLRLLRVVIFGYFNLINEI